MKHLILTVAVCLIFTPVIMAQHPHHTAPRDTVSAKKTTPTKSKKQKKAAPAKDTMQMKKTDMGMHDHAGHEMSSLDIGMTMPSHAYSRILPMNRNGSGTGWNPDATPMYMWMSQSEGTDWMFHGNLYARYTNTDIFNKGIRGDEKFSAPNWFMVMMNRKIGAKGLLNATGMISLDRLTEGGVGYPLLFQSGETWKGAPLVDRQHPHDLFSALSIGYSHMVSKDVDLFGYFGYPGEPALGATAFMHRLSAVNDPDAPLGHHWQDATHITFGVATLGIRYRDLKLEGSRFTGREPDEERWGFDKPRFDSYSYRLSFNPGSNWAFQFSQGFIKEPEALEPGVDITRTTASALYARPMKAGNHLDAAFIWGLNNKGEDHKEHSLLTEANLQLNKNALFSRYEFIQKSGEELGLANGLEHGIFNIHVFSLGYNRKLFESSNIEFTAGTKATVNFPAKSLKPLYGELPVGFQVYLQARPGLHKHH